VTTLNKVYRENPAMWQRDHEREGFVWIDGGNADGNVLSFLRYDDKGNPVACVINFSGGPHHDFALQLPKTGKWNEILNTDAHEYGGSGVGNFGQITTDSNGLAHISVPPLGAVWFKPAQ
jgi:1,4-alpha-glucan branching enzyme